MELKDYEPMHRWFDLCHRNGVNVGAATAMSQQLITAYNEPHRRYHTLDHVVRCLDLLDLVQLEQEERDLIEYALWFHDIVYIPESGTNETESAEIAERWIINQGLSIGKAVTGLILQSADYLSNPPSGKVQGLFHDLDLHVFGSTSREYQEYASNIRKEYSHLNETEFQKGRKKFLQTMLARPSIYATAPFREMYQEQALTNIDRELQDM
ncbi:MAG: hypothetical protein VYD77_04955 [Actinomycetota bacterium]|nr:hypothetical protein [Actinomycetota bacterium]